MNREMRRKKAKENNNKIKKITKVENWIKSLNPEQIQLINSYKVAEHEADKKFLLSQLDNCISAALIEETEMSLDEMEYILARATEMLVENAEFLKKYESCGGIAKVLNKLEKPVRDRIYQLLDSGAKQNEIIKLIKNEFKELKSSHVACAYKKALENWNTNKEGETEMTKSEEVIKWLRENQNQIQAKEKSAIIKDLSKMFSCTYTTAQTYYYRWKKEYLAQPSKPVVSKAPAGKKEVSKADPIKKVEVKKVEAEAEAVVTTPEIKSDVITTEKPKSKLKVVSRSLVVNGEFGEYILSDEGLKVGDMTFTTKEGVENYYKQELDKLNERVNEYREVFNLA